MDFHCCLSLNMAPQYIDGHDPDVLLLDYQFEHEQTGFDMLKRLRQENTGVPVVVLTAFNLVEIASRAFRLGAVDFLSKKDMTPDTLASAVNKALRRSGEEQFPSSGDRKGGRKDPLTGLYNRKEMKVFLERELSRNEKVQIAMLFIDVDDFQFLVQRHGHEMASYVLSQIGDVLQDEVRPSDMPVRFGGDEFCVLQKIMDVGESVDLAEQLVTRFDRDLSEGPSGEPIEVSCSMGISFLDADEPKRGMIQSLIYLTDDALRNARFKPGNSYFVKKS